MRGYSGERNSAQMMRYLSRLFLITTAAVLSSKGYGDGSSFGGNTMFTLAFCDTNIGIRQRRPLYRASRGTSEAFQRKGTKNHVLKLPISQLEAAPIPLSGGTEESQLFFWVAAFSFSHIGMSAIRQTLISDVFGKFLANDILGIVGTGKFRLPDFWPGDSSGTNELFPDIETTGRQFYRVFYTMVSFLTLGTSFSIYLGMRESNIFPTSHDISVQIANSGELMILLSYAIATFAGAFSLASLVNASPLGLMPSFRQKNDEGSGFYILSSNTSRGKSSEAVAGDTLLGITRDDGLKFDPKGLTRITRHPLILPVFPWGIATSVLAGGRSSDAILFCGLSLYSVAGCYCQDLRVTREEGSVGTVFFGANDDSDIAAQTKTTINQKLRLFYDETSFLPFQALLDGRQSWALMLQEFPTFPFLLAIPSEFAIEAAFLRFLGVEYNFLM